MNRPLRHTRLAAAALVAAAFAVRLYRLPAQSLSYDEAVSAYLTALPLREMLAWTAADVQPPLYYLLLKAWTSLAGLSEFSLRFLSVMLSVALVPVLFRLASRLHLGKAAPVAALVAAIHPWYVWHAQDARMYSLLLLLGASASLALLDWVDCDGERPWRAVAALALSYVSLLYTHYLGAGLIAAHLLSVVWWSYRSPARRLLPRYVRRVLVPAAILFAPWVPAALRTMRSDTSYFVGSLKLDEALRKAMVALFVGGPGETVLEGTGVYLAAAMAAVLVLALLVRRSRAALWPLGISLATLVATLAVFLVVPKFNPRYLVLASLPLPLLWGQAVSLVWRQSERVGRWIGVAALGAVVVGSSAGIGGMFWDQRLTRSDFRSAIADIRAQMSPGEVVVLVSGHLYPVWDYYAPGIPYVPLPKMRVLDVDSSLDLSVAGDLRDALAGASGAWLLLWQDEVVDPMGSVTFLLDQVAPAEERGYWHVRTRHYRLDSPPDLPDLASPEIAAACRFEGGIEYLGQVPDAAGNVALLWRAMQPLELDLRAQVTVSDAQGHEVMRVHLWPGGDRYPTSLWLPGRVAFVRLDPSTPPGIAEGVYPASVTLYEADSGRAWEVLDAAGNPAGQSCSLGTVRLEGNTVGVDASAAAAEHGLQPVGPQGWQCVTVLALGRCPTGPLAPGTDVALPILVAAGQSEISAGASLTAVLAGGDTERPVGEVPLPVVVTPSSTGSVHLLWLDGRVPADSPDGPAELRLRPAQDGSPGDDLVACVVSVAPVGRDFTRPAPEFPSGAMLGGMAELVGLDVEPTQAAAGGTVHVVLHFEAAFTPDRNYTVFLHLLSAEGRVLAQAEGVPPGRPTAGWLGGEVVRAEFDLAIPADLEAGRYAFEVGWYLPDAPGMPRVPVTVAGAESSTDSVMVGWIDVG